MVTETRAKKYNDYSASAVNLCNPETVEVLITALSNITELRNALEEKAQALIPDEIKENLKKADDKITELQQQIKEAVDTHGSFQDLAIGWYAVKQRKVSKSYDASLLETAYPQYAPAVIIKAVDTTKLTGLIKGGLLDEAQLKAGNIIQEKESFAYVIKC